MEPLTVNIDEARRVLGIGRSNVYDLMKSGALDKHKIGGRTVISTASIKRFVASLEIVG